MHGHEHTDTPADHHTPDPATWWEQRYADSDGVWSGRVNAVLAQTVPSLLVWSGRPPRALDLGCGEGADVIWLAEHGWEVTGVDLSPTAVERAGRAAVAEDVPERTTFVAADLATWAPEPGTTYDLVTASFLQSWPAEIPRAAILRRARDLVAPGGYLLVTAHGAPPHADLPEEMRSYRFPTPEGDLEALGLGAGEAGEPAVPRPSRAVPRPSRAVPRPTPPTDGPSSPPSSAPAPSRPRTAAHTRRSTAWCSSTAPDLDRGTPVASAAWVTTRRTSASRMRSSPSSATARTCRRDTRHGRTSTPCAPSAAPS